MLESGKHIGNYILVRKLGAGGFGEVWQAEKHTKLSVSNFALKFFRPKEGDQINLDKEKREISIWQKVSGLPNIISIIEADEFEEYIYVVSEYADGGSLEKQMTATGGRPFPIDQAVTITLEVLSGLNSLHQMAFVHRDIKPANILIRRGVHCLADFGISREMKAHSKATQTAGTYEYMAPEAFENKPVTIHSDIWAVGAIFQQLLTGGLPFPQKEIPSLIYAILHGEPVKLPDHIPAGIQKVVVTALEKDPQNRFGSAMEMMTALKYQQMLLNNPEWGGAKSSQETLVWGDQDKTQMVEAAQARNTFEPRPTQASSPSSSMTEKTQFVSNASPTGKTEYSGNYEIPSIAEANRKKSKRPLIFALAGGGSLLILVLAAAALAFAFRDKIFSSNSTTGNTAVSTANANSTNANTSAGSNSNRDVKAEAAKSPDSTETSAAPGSSPETKPSAESSETPISKPTPEIVRQKQNVPPATKTAPVVKQPTPKKVTKPIDDKCIYTGDC